ncbi:hypothetical protein FEE96_13900 [Parasedimentitalea maritima]|uniref:Uncharacterized protein n=1 Tax=Parasedimentitalea maritima TaxID=2578117 RepID=A0ABY2UY94_9RHOB|nr:hypothetical protein [Zongyanglinia marina]TLP62821.1 hypothetical protein FEE96_13900 [Zongyanglinia marina]
MTLVSNTTVEVDNDQFLRLCDRLSAFLLQTRKRNLAHALVGDDEFSNDMVGEDFKNFEKDLTSGLQLTPYDQLRIQSRVRKILRSSNT